MRNKERCTVDGEGEGEKGRSRRSNMLHVIEYS